LKNQTLLFAADPRIAPHGLNLLLIEPDFGLF